MKIQIDETTEITVEMEDLLALGSVVVEFNGKKYTITINDRDYDQMRKSDYLR